MSHPNILYLDTNVYLDLCNQTGGVRQWHVGVLRRMLRTQKASVVIGVLNIDEIVANFPQDPVRTQAELSFALGLAEKGRVVRPHFELVPEAIVCYAKGLDPPSYYTTDERLCAEWLDLTSLGPDEERSLSSALAETQQQKKAYRIAVEEFRSDILAQFTTKNHRLSFRSMWDVCAPVLAHGLALRAGVLTECEVRGLEGLLDIRPVRLWIAAFLSRACAQLFEGRVPRTSDYDDNLHAVSASAADTFVTHDLEFARQLGRANVSGFRVVSLAELLQNAGQLNDADV